MYFLGKINVATCLHWHAIKYNVLTFNILGLPVMPQHGCYDLQCACVL